MAVYSTGLSVVFSGNGATLIFGEVSDFSWSYGGGSARGRDSSWTDELGTVSVTFFGGGLAANISNYGRRGILQSNGAGASLTVPAEYQSLTFNPELNGVTSYTVTFKILDA